MKTTLILSLFPGIGLLDRAFEQEGHCVVRGPDLLWGGDVRTFHPPPKRFDGVIGGPPCQRFSPLAALVRHVHGEDALAEDMIPEYCRCVAEAQPDWWLMENVPGAPVPAVAGYEVHSQLLDNRWIDRGDGVGEDQSRIRRWTFGSRTGARLDMGPELAVMRSAHRVPTATSGGTRWEPAAVNADGSQRRGRPASIRSRANLAEITAAQGLPDDWDIAPPFTVRAAIAALGNGVPIPMGRAIARSVRRATGLGSPSPTSDV